MCALAGVNIGQLSLVPRVAGLLPSGQWIPQGLHVVGRLDLAILFASGGWVSRDAATAASGEDFGEEGGEEEAIGVRGPLDARASALRFVIGNRLVAPEPVRSEEHTSELQSLMRISYAVFCLKKKKKTQIVIKKTY